MKLIYYSAIFSIFTCLSLTACDQHASDSTSSPPTEQAVSVAPSSTPVPTEKSDVSGTAKPEAIIPQAPETGIPKEENIVSDPKKPDKVSSLKPIYNVGKDCVAITIDDGPTKNTKDLLKMLKEQNVHVTFFFLGQNAAAYPESVTQAVYEGNEVGYHSDTHPQMSKMTYSDQEKEFESGLAKLKKWDTQPVTLFRPPYGAYNNDTKLITEEHQMSMVLWNEDPKDWSSKDPKKIADNVLSQVKSGSIIVLHDHPSTIAALPAIIKGIKSKGFKLVMLSKH
ncbi:polysaccharide deacetylase family protein [Paenibacillus sp. SYP-B3998]|uniref:Polysaccharide deacetylase family protein n=1 Tax=Paenibacillus sp. SYP-B3998 TaxID=2678564 RepID=A0A6G3ZZV7_9BACL|nr:polysaccharide deacetylase family protein [Paenibacillus sp. SYP-B3998]NEW06937.1 polysaccharide deacetylase family protein [Paenibacillus sp. SYP-B3998]